MRVKVQGTVAMAVCLAVLNIVQEPLQLRLYVQEWETATNIAGSYQLYSTASNVATLEQQEAKKASDASRAFDMSNLHENFPLKCGQSPAWIHPAIPNLIDLTRNNLATEARRRGKFGHGGHSGSDFMGLIQLQVCLYDVVHRWNQLSRKLGITQWAAHGGTAIGAKCFGAVNPWDDDVDITIANCTALDELWKNGDNVTERYPDLDPRRYEMDNKKALWDARVIDDDLILTKGDRGCKWYKLMTVNQVRFLNTKQILGIDMECFSRKLSKREIRPKRKSGWISHMKNQSSKLDEVTFGPTTIQLMPQPILDKYIHMRYGKQSPCHFPYENGELAETYLGNSSKSLVAKNDLERYTGTVRRRFNIDYATAKWYIPKKKREQWRKQVRNNKQNQLTQDIPNLDDVEIDNTIAKPGACDWGQEGATTTLKAIGFNAKHGKYWDLFGDMVNKVEDLKDPHVILMNEMDIGMARSNNVHTVRRLALELGMNYAWGLEFVELTRGTKQEQNATVGRRDALSLHGNAILTKCFIADPMILRDPLPPGYFATKPVRGINANGFDIRLGGRMGLFARIYKEDPKSANANATQPYFVVGNVHKIGETNRQREILWDYFGFGRPPNSTNLYEGVGTDPPNQLGVVMQGDFGPKLCALGGLTRKNGRKNKAFPIRCTPTVHTGKLVSDFFCSNMDVARELKVTASCYFPGDAPVIRLSNHGIVSVAFTGNDVPTKGSA